LKSVAESKVCAVLGDGTRNKKTGETLMNPAFKQNDYFTYTDYRTWPEEERWELIHGDVYAMTAPTRMHQKFVLELGRQISNYLQGKPCEAYVAPFDVRLPRAQEADEQVDTVVQPDIAVICDSNKLDDKGCRGAPDWIIEVLSPSTAFKDLEIKRGLYQAHGVREYWIIHPLELWGMIYVLNAQGEYGQARIIELKDASEVMIFPDLQLAWDFLIAAT
jgi:Uma2 family endonuclease